MNVCAGLLIALLPVVGTQRSEAHECIPPRVRAPYRSLVPSKLQSHAHTVSVRERKHALAALVVRLQPLEPLEYGDGHCAKALHYSAFDVADLRVQGSLLGSYHR